LACFAKLQNGQCDRKCDGRFLEGVADETYS
jgi:hypothetical protein